MCEYCGCRDIPLIGRLSEEHYEAVDALGVLRRAITAGDAGQVADAVALLSGHLFPHNDSEEAGLFRELARDEYFEPTISELIDQHRLFRGLVERISAGEWDAYAALEEALRHHIDREENGLFPATAVAVDGTTWEEIDRLTHAFNHAHHREHAHSEAEAFGVRSGVPDGPDLTPPAAKEPGRTPAAQHLTGPDVPPVVSLDDPYVVRRATPADAAELVALWRQSGLDVPTPELVAEELASVAALHPQLALVATAGESIVGSILGTWDGRRAWINRLATRRDWRGRGVAGALLETVEDAVRALGGRKVNLLIEADNYGVVDYYEAHGYATDDLIFMEKFL